MRGYTQKSTFALVLGLLLFTTGSAAQSFNFTTIDVPCGAAPPTSCPNGIARQTFVNGINPAGDMVGAYFDGVGRRHGFLLSAGQFTTIDVPGALVGAAGVLSTNPKGISPAGDIVGVFTSPYIPGVSDRAPQDSASYCPATGSVACAKGFLYSHGKFSTVLFPGHPGAIPQRITPDGDIYGCLHDFDLTNSMFGSVWSRSGDTSLAANGGELADALQSMPMSMNMGATPDGHTIVGLWTDMNNHAHGFVVQNGVSRLYDVPGSSQTTIWDMNPGGEFVGTYVDSTSHQHGFLQLSDGSAPINVDYPGAAATIAFGINPGGAIVGQYTDTGHQTHGFLAVPAGD
jgi:hypothetical protein